MPQLDVTTFAPQLVWLAITFIAMYVIMAKVALPRVGQILEERQNRIDDDLDRAATLKEEAEAAAVAYDEALTKARAEAQAAIREVSDQLSAEAAERQKALGDKLAADIAAGEKKIAAARDAAIGQISEISGDLTKEAAEKLAGVKVTDKAIEDAVAAVMGARAR
ncbi:MAG: F0F1 ATP synthase subunit B' [Rhodospirillales bacterium]|nr:F0F1 ATP synthase subunit B' [Rhodospirillales bacterium]MCW8862485.1 F0F1 ATP synthase subunit B' [Rhodospirillales bacterium]MCW9002095.1 F0F1 ATP synthase subunit B' [Rhodospirillales bacterium]MCW9040523.1 F0F1 ATP synthase subunit B' [Rhodospirillales bacterium]